MSFFETKTASVGCFVYKGDDIGSSEFLVIRDVNGLLYNPKVTVFRGISVKAYCGLAFESRFGYSTARNRWYAPMESIYFARDLCSGIKLEYFRHHAIVLVVGRRTSMQSVITAIEQGFPHFMRKEVNE